MATAVPVSRSMADRREFGIMSAIAAAALNRVILTESSFWYPSSAELYSAQPEAARAALGDIITQELGIAESEQHWHGEE